MKLVIGGACQGKLRYVMESGGFSEESVARGDTLPLEDFCEKPVLWGLHLLVRRLLEAGQEPQAWLETHCRMEEMTFLCDEVGCGVVPIRREDRDWREAVGRLCCRLATRSEEVVRVYAGLAQRIK